MLTANSETPFEHLRSEDGVDDAAMPVHPFQQRIVQLNATPPSVLAGCTLMFPLYVCCHVQHRLVVLRAQLFAKVILQYFIQWLADMLGYHMRKHAGLEALLGHHPSCTALAAQTSVSVVLSSFPTYNSHAALLSAVPQAGINISKDAAEAVTSMRT